MYIYRDGPTHLCVYKKREAHTTRTGQPTNPSTPIPISSHLFLKQNQHQTRLGNGSAVMGLDVEMDFSSILSLGEQQRLAFGRLVYNR